MKMRKNLVITSWLVVGCLALSFILFAATPNSSTMSLPQLSAKAPLPVRVKASASVKTLAPHVAAQNPVSSSLEERIAALEAQVISTSATESAVPLDLKLRLDELYAQRPENRRRANPLDQGSDTCAATVIGAIPYFDSGTTAGRVDNFSGTCVGSGAPDVIYQVTPTVTQVYSISLCGSSYDTGLIIKTGGACPGTTEVACNDDACGTASELNVALTSGVTYYIIVDGYTGQSGAYVP